MITQLTSRVIALLIPSRITLTVAGLFLVVTLLPGQGIDSTLMGTVTDSSAAAVPRSQVTATNRDTGVVTSTSTDGVGQYRIEHLPVGFYDVTASAPSFAPRTSASVMLQLNRTVRVDLPLELSTASITVQVTDAAAPIDTASSHLQVTFDARALTTIPAASSGSGFLNLSLLGGGVASSGGLGQGTGPSVGGQRPSGNRFYLEGVDNNSYFTTGPLGTVSTESLAEFTLLQNHYGSQFGGANGGIFDAIVKSGGKENHGSLYEYLQNRNLNALDASYARQGATSPPRFDENRLGATFGGPVLKHKLFYFGSFEYNPAGFAFSPPSLITAPTAGGFQTLKSLAGLNQVNLGILAKYTPAAPVAGKSIQVLGTSIPVGPLSIISPSYGNWYRAVGSMDWDMSAHDRVRGRYLYSRFSGIDTTSVSLPAFFAIVPSNTHLVSLSEYHTLSAATQNDFRAAYSRNDNRRSAPDFSYPGLDSFPTLYFRDIDLQLGANAANPNGQIQDELQLSDTITTTRGRHTLKIGYDFRDVLLSTSFVSYPRGYYGYQSLQQFLLDLTPDYFGNRFLGTTGPLVNGMPAGFLQNAAFVQDDFRITQKLTLNLGARYEYVTVPVLSRAQQYSSIADVPGVIAFREPQPRKNDWSPSLGFAYSPGKGGIWAIRGGFNRTFDMPYTNLSANTAPAFYGNTVGVNINSNTPGFLASGGLNRTSAALSSPAAARAATSGYTPDQMRPYALTYTLGVERLLARDYTLEARYTGTRGVHLLVQEQINRMSAVKASNSIPTFLTLPPPAALSALTLTTGALKAIPSNTLAQYGFTNSASITALEPRGNSQYNGLVLQVTKRYSRNFSYLAAYTWSHLMDDSTADINSTVLTPRRPQDFGNLASEWASSALDRRQRLTISPIFDFKPFSRRGWALQNLLGNWNLAFTYTYQSPEYATVQSGVDSNLNNDSAADRSIINPNGVAGTGSGVTGYDRNGNAVSPSSQAIVAYVANNPNARYIVAGLGAYANGGRNTLPLAPVNNIDASLRKIFSISEQRRVEIGAQFYNLLNHPQFAGGYTDDVSLSKTTSRNFLTPGDPTFGQYRQFFPSNSRYIQILARFTF
jgi:Carboxypeptidase regulatory-like domain/TonB dependent receptor